MSAETRDDRWRAAHKARLAWGFGDMCGCDDCPIGRRQCDSRDTTCDFFGGYEHDEGVVLCRHGMKTADRAALASFMGWTENRGEQRNG